MAITRVTLNGFRQETGTTARVYLDGFRQENSGSSGSSAALTGLAATSAITGPSILHTQALSGLEATGAQTGPSVLHTQSLAGLEGTSERGEVTGLSYYTSALTGQQLTAEQTGPGVLHSNALSGLEATGSQTSPTAAHSNPITGLEATSEYGLPALLRTHPLTGLESTAQQTAPTSELAAVLGGLQWTSEQGGLGVNISAALASALATISLGDLTVLLSATARPTSDISAGTWTPNTGVDLFAVIDEVVADDGDYDTSTSPVGDTFEVKFSSLTDPVSSVNHKVRYRLVGVDGAVDFTVSLRQGATEIASWTHLDVTTATTFEQTLSGAEADAITNYGDLRIRFTATV